jgi:ketoreductase
VTGGTSGIGLATVRALAVAGFDVAFCGRDDTRVKSTAAALAEDGITASGYVCDVRDGDRIGEFLEEVITDLGHPTVLINNAGRGGGGPTARIEDDLWFDVLDTNLTSVFRMTRAVLQRCPLGPGSRIVMIASTGGKQGVPLGAPYSASKAGVIGFTKALAKELAPSGTTVNAVCPGYVETPMAVEIREHYAAIRNSSTDDILAEFQSKIPLGRYSTPEEVAAMIRYLCLPEAGSVTAQALNVCGGLGSY